MLAIFIILFRETLEITLLVGIISAATRGLKARNYFLNLGVTTGLIISVIIAYFTNNIAQSLQGRAQDLLNAFIMLSASIMIGWTVTWMKQNIGQLKDEIHLKSASIKAGKSSIYTLTALVASVVIREGVEIILFTYGAAKTTEINNYELIIGAVSGTLVGIILGMLIYYSIVKINKKYLFLVTNSLLILLAAGMAARIPNYLASADVLAELSTPLWDSSNLLKENSTVGQLLHLIIGYCEKPTIMQLIFYFGTMILIISSLFKKEQEPPMHNYHKI